MSKKQTKKEKAQARASDQAQAADVVGMFRDRIIDFRKVKASELRAHPENWRLHPDHQRSALQAMLEDVGFVGAVLARETPEGLQIIDGHLRTDLAGDAEVPVLVTDLDDDEVRKVLLTFDPLSGLAIPDSEALAGLLDGVALNEDNAELRKLLADLRAKLAKEEKERDDPDAERVVDGMALEPHEHYDFLVVLCTTAQEWNVLCDRLGLVPTRRRRGRMGTARAIHAKQLLDRIPQQ